MVSSVPSNPSSAWGGAQARGEDGDDGVASKPNSIASTLQAITETAGGVYRAHRTCKDARKPFALCASSDETVPCITEIHVLTPKRAHNVVGKRWLLVLRVHVVQVHEGRLRSAHRHARAANGACTRLR